MTDSQMIDPIEHLLSRMQIDSIIKEAHKKPIVDVSMNRAKGLENLMVTAADTEVSIYDNNHCDGHMDLMAHFVNQRKGYTERKDWASVTGVCWIGDGKQVAAADEHGTVSIVSIIDSRVIAQYAGHNQTHIDNISCFGGSKYVVSTSKDPNKKSGSIVRIWNTTDHSSFAIIHIGARVQTTLYDSENKILICGDSDGHVMYVSLESDSQQDVVVFYKNPLNQAIVSIKPVSSTKSSMKLIIQTRQDLFLLEVSINGLVANARVTSSLALGGKSNGCGYDFYADPSTPETIYIAYGNHDAEVIITKWTVGEFGKAAKEIKKLTPPTNRRLPIIKGVALSSDCKSLMAVGDDGVIWRFVEGDEKKKEIVEETAEPTEQTMSENQQEQTD